MAQKINITDHRWQDIKKACYGCSKEFLQNALNTARRLLKQQQITKKAGLEMSHWMLAELVFFQIKQTDLCEENGLAFWIDKKGIFKIRLSPILLNPATESNTADD